MQMHIFKIVSSSLYVFTIKYTLLISFCLKINIFYDQREIIGFYIILCTTKINIRPTIFLN